MRFPIWARWATCALAISMTVPFAFADRATKKSLSECATFDQQDKGDDIVELTIHNTCTVPVDCSISWRLVCAPESKKRRATHASKKQLAVTDGTSQSTEASAAICGDASWAIDQIRWSCEPNND